MVVTTTYVTQEEMPILYVTHESGEGGEIIWQFHCDNGDYRPSVLQLVLLREIVQRDEGVAGLASLPLGCSAKRKNVGDDWTIETL